MIGRDAGGQRLAREQRLEHELRMLVRIDDDRQVEVAREQEVQLVVRDLVRDLEVHRRLARLQRADEVHEPRNRNHGGAPRSNDPAGGERRHVLQA